MANSIRENIARSIVNVVENMDTPTYEFKFSKVQREPVENIAHGKNYMAAVFDVEEQKTPRAYPVMDCTMTVIIEFYIRFGKGDPMPKLNTCLTELQRALRVDRVLGGLAVDMVETGNQFDLDGPFDQQVNGALFMNVLYRHHIDDPRNTVSGTTTVPYEP